MSVKLDSVTRESESTALVEIARITVPGSSPARILAVAKRGSTYLLTRESERGLFTGGATSAADDTDKRDRKHGTETYLKPTSNLADFADAVAHGLVE